MFPFPNRGEVRDHVRVAVDAGELLHLFADLLPLAHGWAALVRAARPSAPDHEIAAFVEREPCVHVQASLRLILAGHASRADHVGGWSPLERDLAARAGVALPDLVALAGPMGFQEFSVLPVSISSLLLVTHAEGCRVHDVDEFPGLFPIIPNLAAPGQPAAEA